MKRIVVLATLLAFILGMAGVAAAADIKATGSWKIFAKWTDQEDLVDDGENAEDDFDVEQRVRTKFTFTANENLEGVLYTEVGSANWGAGAFAFGGDAIGIEVKQAYVHWVWPNTDVNFYAGLMGVGLPGGAFGNPVLDDDVAAFVMTTPVTDFMGLQAGWVRAYDQDVANDNGDAQVNDGNFDVLFLALPFDFDGVAFTPYFAYGYAGEGITRLGAAAIEGLGHGLASSNNTLNMFDDNALDVWYGGLTFDLTMFDPLSLQASFVYGSADLAAKGDNDYSEAFERAGWVADISLEYTGFDFVTPQLFFSYSSGEDGNGTDADGEDNDGESNRLPTIGGAYNTGAYWSSDSQMAIDDAFRASVGQQLGYWALGLNLKDISFLEGLTHSLGFVYYQGTNDQDIGTAYADAAAAAASQAGVAYGTTLTEDDSIFEFSFVNKYQIYEQLTATVGYAYAGTDFEEDNWTEIDNSLESSPDAQRFVIGVEYKF